MRGELLLIARYRRLHDHGSRLLLITIDGVSLEPEAARRRTSVRYYLDVTVCGGGCGVGVWLSLSTRVAYEINKLIIATSRFPLGGHIVNG